MIEGFNHLIQFDFILIRSKNYYVNLIEYVVQVVIVVVIVTVMILDVSKHMVLACFRTMGFIFYSPILFTD